MPIEVKICGVKDEAAVKAAVEHGAAFIGFNFCPVSPRYVTPGKAAELAPLVTGRTRKVALFVDPDDDTLNSVLKIFTADVIQLHGCETPPRVAEIKARYKKPVIKAFPIRSVEDMEEIIPYEADADWFLFDARAPEGAQAPGGHGMTFDWTILKNHPINTPWFLAGGLTAANVQDAMEKSGARRVDVASGVESARGVKDAGMIGAFLNKALRSV
jgi:phosphoribosylanthranilate isomerase